MSASSIQQIKKPKGINVYVKPSPSEKTAILAKINNQGMGETYICYPNIQPIYLTKSILDTKTKFIVYGWNSDLNEPSLDDKFITSILTIQDSNPLEIPTDISLYLDIICTSKTGHGYSLFSHFVGYIKNIYPNKNITLTLQTASNAATNLVKTYENWGFKQVFAGCTNQCYMTYNINTL